MSAYGRAGDIVRFYELDPDVLQMSQTQFSYLNSSPATLEFVIGDARLSMERELLSRRRSSYDVLAIDAFSSDSIPVHLITREATALFLQRTEPDGDSCVHISNRFLDLKPVLANIAPPQSGGAAHGGFVPAKKPGLHHRLGAAGGVAGGV